MAQFFGELRADDRRHASKSPAVTVGTGKAPRAQTLKIQGSQYLTSTGFLFDTESITADHIQNYKTKNVFGRGIQRQQRSMLFRKPYSVEMIDPNGETNEEQSKVLKKMLDAPAVSFGTRMMQSFDGVAWFGVAPYNPVADWIGNAYTMTELRYLPPHTFKMPGSPEGTILSQGHFLKGICMTEKDTEPQYWQTTKDKPELIENVYAIKEPDCELVAGDPIFYPIFPLFEMLKYSLNSRMQQVNRIAAPLMFATLPVGADDDVIKDTKKILRNWNKDTTFTVPEGVTIEVIDIKENTTVDNAIKTLNNILISYVSPAHLLHSGDQATRLGGSDNAAQEMINDYTAGQLEWIQNVWQNFLMEIYVLPNGFDDGWTVKVTIPAPSIDKSMVNIQKATTILNSNKRGIVHPNEVREMLDLDDADDKTFEENQAAWDLIKGEDPLAGGFGGQNGGFGNGNPAQPPDEKKKAAEAAKKKETPMTQSVRRVSQTNSLGEAPLTDDLTAAIESFAQKVNAQLTEIEP